MIHDVAIVGAGMAGASLAAAIGPRARTRIAENVMPLLALEAMLVSLGGLQGDAGRAGAREGRR